ncbi:thioredoxin family protein [Pseudomonas costantinii]|uniref:thioredoxin family protein n=1 Tax=Pseudomonas costantinii TaxID=168469 RepID=UPI0015A383D1|nr:thioredoxin family protein [Pseudomonas costantinii]NVZ70968.1 thioredoxin family protein [Pseudomonas costantinii]
MGAANAVIKDLDEYQQILKQHPLVIVLFTSKYCQACLGASPRFNRIAEKYAHCVKSMILDTEQTPKIENVEGTPTAVVYQNGLEVENLKGIGYPDEQEELLEDLFSLYAKSASLT